MGVDATRWSLTRRGGWEFGMNGWNSDEFCCIFLVLTWQTGGDENIGGRSDSPYIGGTSAMTHRLIIHLKTSCISHRILRALPSVEPEEV